jgi:hypothetical protein
MTVADVERSVGFYSNVLSFEKVSDVEVVGSAYEQLQGVFGLRMRVAKGPGIEFLEYLTPRDGRPMPTDARANDLMHWQTTLVARDITSVAHRLWAGKFALVSPALVTLSGGQLGFTAGLLVRDPAGHAVQVIER